MSDNPLSGEVEAEIEQILDDHAEFYIRQTMKFFRENGESPALSRNNPGDLQSKSKLTKLLLEQRIEEVDDMVVNEEHVTYDDYSGGNAVSSRYLVSRRNMLRSQLNQLDKEKHE